MTQRAGSPKWKKALRASPRELVARGVQAVAVLSERTTLSSLTREPSFAAIRRMLTGTAASCHDESVLLEHFRDRPGPRLFAALDNSTVVAIRRHFPDTEHGIIARAERAMDGKFDFLGRQGLDFGTPIDWSLDPLSGIRAPNDHWAALPFLSRSAVGDHKVIWELNRHQHFVRLGQAYALTGDERYAEAFAKQIGEWLDANPPQRGMNWVSSLELSIRAISWLWALHFFRSSPALTADLFRRILGSLYLHGRHIERYLSTYFSPNTHLSGEALGLLYLGVLLPELRCASRWQRLGAQILIELLDRHVLGDGVYFERASYYQRYTADIYLHALLLSDANGLSLRHRIVPPLSRLLEHLDVLERPDGLTPLVGDDDGGRLVPLGDPRSPVADFRSTLCVGGVLLDRLDWIAGRTSRADEALWLIGSAAVSDALAAASGRNCVANMNASRAFPEGGYYVLRDGSSANANYALFDAGPLGVDNCGHAHADALAVEICANGVPICIDAGTYTYVGDDRDYFRGTGAHSTVCVDGEPSSLPATEFSWRHAALARVDRWISTERFDFVRGLHDGFHRLPSPATHRRSILFLKKDYWIVRDELESATSHVMELRWQLAPGVTVLTHDGTRVLVEGEHGGRRSRLTMHSLLDENCAYQVSEGKVSPGFGQSVPSKALSLTAHSSPHGIVTLLLPHAATEQSADTQTAAESLFASLPTTRGSLWKLQPSKGIMDLLMFDSCRSHGADHELDGEYAWIRQGNESPVQEFLLVAGRGLRCPGGLRIAADQRCEYIVGVFERNTWSIAADKPCLVQIQAADMRWAVTAVATSEVARFEDR